MTVDTRRHDSAADWTPERITNLRARLGLTLRELAKRCGVHIGSVQKWIAPESSASKTSPRGAARVILEQLEEEARKHNPKGIELIDPRKTSCRTSSQEDWSRRKRFAQNLRALIEARGVYQKELADALNVSPSHVSKWLAGVRLPTIGQCEALAEYLGIAVEDMEREGIATTRKG